MKLSSYAASIVAVRSTQTKDEYIQVFAQEFRFPALTFTNWEFFPIDYVLEIQGRCKNPRNQQATARGPLL